jgi:hypothetical protein
MAGVRNPRVAFDVLFAYQGGRCAYCLRGMTIRPCHTKFTRQTDATFDHVVPIKEGGRRARWNLVLACAACNQAKGEKRWRPKFKSGYVQTPNGSFPRRGHKPSGELLDTKGDGGYSDSGFVCPPEGSP